MTQEKRTTVAKERKRTTMAEERKRNMAKGKKRQGECDIWREGGSAKRRACRQDEKGLPQHHVSPSTGCECRHVSKWNICFFLVTLSQIDVRSRSRRVAGLRMLRFRNRGSFLSASDGRSCAVMWHDLASHTIPRTGDHRMRRGGMRRKERRPARIARSSVAETKRPTRAIP